MLVDILAQLSPETNEPDIVFENDKKVLYVRVIKAMYSMLVASLCWYKSSWRTTCCKFLVDDLVSSYKAPIVNDELLKWLNMKDE